MKYYKTRYENNIYFSLILLIIGIISFALFIKELVTTQYIDVMIILLSMFVFGITSFLLCYFYRYNKKKIMNHGKKVTGKIIYAEYITSYRGNNTYYLIIEFEENKRKLLHRTKGYKNDPNYILDSPYCCIYSYKGRYIEGNFRIKNNNTSKRKIIETKKINPFKLVAKKKI